MESSIFRSKQSDKYEASLALQSPRIPNEISPTSNVTDEELAQILSDMLLVERNAERAA